MDASEHPSAENGGALPPRLAEVRLIRRTLREKLPEIMLEAASVVFAVLLALGVDEWRDVRAKQELAVRAQASVVAEVRGNLGELRQTWQTNRQVLAELSRQAQAVDSPATRRLTGSVDISLAQLSSAAWQTAQATQASASIDYDWMLRAARLYDLQALYAQSQAAVLDDLSRIDPDARRSLLSLRARLAVQQELGAGLLKAYDDLLRHPAQAKRQTP
jgi:hypothetical protein